MHQAVTDSNVLLETIGKTFEQVSKDGAVLSANQVAQWDQSREVANQVQGSLQNMRDTDLAAFGHVMFGMFEKMVSTHDAPMLCLFSNFGIRSFPCLLCIKHRLLLMRYVLIFPNVSHHC